MAIYRGGVGGLSGAFARAWIILEMIKWEHTIFALPFAFIGALIGAQRTKLPHGMPTPSMVFWIIAAMFGARSAAMAFNRIVDARFDSENPRTRMRAIPTGLVTSGQAAIFAALSSALLVFSAWKLNPLCLLLSPVALLAVLGYSYTKRFTSLSHFALGAADGIAPIGAWIAVTGRIELIPVLIGLAVTFWIGGFDIIYALQDYEFDARTGLHSLPGRFGKARALWISRIMHLLMIMLLVTIGWLGSLHFVYFVGVALVAMLICYEQSIVSPNDISRVNLAFFTLNGWISVSLLAFLLLDRLVS